MLVGADGIRDGWIAALLVDGILDLRRSDNLRQMIPWAFETPESILVVDIPIGLTESTPRRADKEARAFLGAKGSSVFSCPYVEMLPAVQLPLKEAQQEASRRRREIEGGLKGCSIQSAAILPKVAEAEAAISPDLQRRVREGHPEVSFAVMNGGRAVLSKKKRTSGRGERLALLAPHFGDLRPYIQEGRRLGAKPDDILDAFAMLWTARRVARDDTNLRRFPSDPEQVTGGKTAQIVA